MEDMLQGEANTQAVRQREAVRLCTFPAFAARSLIVVRLSVQWGVVFKELHGVSGLLCFAINKDGRTALTKDSAACTFQKQKTPLSTMH